MPALPLSFWCRSRKPAGAAWFWAQVQGLDECVDCCVVTEGAASCCRPRSHHAPAFPLCRARVRRACPGEPRGANLAGGRQGQMCGLCLGRRRPQALVTGGTDGRQAPGVALGAGLSAGASDGTPRSSVGDSCGFRCWGQGPYRDLQMWGRLAFPWGGGWRCRFARIFDGRGGLGHTAGEHEPGSGLLSPLDCVPRRGVLAGLRTWPSVLFQCCDLRRFRLGTQCQCCVGPAGFPRSRGPACSIRSFPHVS